MTKEELKNPITEVVRKNDMRNRHGKNLHILLGILDYIDSNISSYDTDGNGSIEKRFKLLGTDENGDTYLLIALNRYPSEDGSNKYATEVGSTKIHLTLNTSEESKYGNKVQVDIPSGEKTLVYSEETPRIKNSINLNQ